jgi:structural maintenance of chromosome 4
MSQFQAMVLAYASKMVIIDICLCQASRIAYGAANKFRRVVTLDSELFERSGTMCGGGNKPQGGGMGTSIRESILEDAIKNAESNLNKLVGDFHKLRGQMNDAKKRYRSLEEAKSCLEMELAKVKKEVCNLAVLCLSLS